MRIRNINSIHVFDSVARYGSVTKAARHFGSTQSSVSYHIKKLEADLGVVLFSRTAHGLELTDEGISLARHVDAGLQQIGEGIDLVTRRKTSVRVALVPMFASRLVSANVSRLQQSCPDVEIVLLNHNNTFVDFADPRAFADFGIQWGKGNWSGVDAVKLWDERLVVVCSPEYRDRLAIESPEDVARCTLLHVDDKRMWAEWSAGCDIALRSDQPSMMLEDRHFQLSSTINGLGISLFAKWLVQAELTSGTLVNPFGRSYPTEFSYFLVTPKGPPLSPGAKRVRDWFLKLSIPVT
ncbi:MAG: LysR family transcriptional regulator [Rhizobiales bacterium]|nr:LysR family transcriptional regulator [Hyphomicrobiales bacterium]